MNQAGTSQAELARAIGVGQATISLVLKGKRGMAGPVARRAANHLKVTLAELSGEPRPVVVDHANIVADAVADVPKGGLPREDVDRVIRQRERDDGLEDFLERERADLSPREIDILRAISGRLPPSRKTDVLFWSAITEAIRGRTWNEKE